MRSSAPSCADDSRWRRAARGCAAGLLAIAVAACGEVYTPQVLPGADNAEPEDVPVVFVTLDASTVQRINFDPYGRRVIDGLNLNAPGRLQTEASAIRAHWPPRGRPGPYRIGAGDVLELTRSSGQGATAEPISQELRVAADGTVKLLALAREGITEVLPPPGVAESYRIGAGDLLRYATIVLQISTDGTALPSLQENQLLVLPDGTVNILGIGQVSVLGMTLDEAQNEISRVQLSSGVAVDFQIAIEEFLSKSFVVGGLPEASGVFPITDKPVTLNQVVTAGLGASEGLNVTAQELSVRLIRDGKTYRITAERLLSSNTLYYVKPGDRIVLERAALTPGPGPILVAKRTIAEARDAIELALNEVQNPVRVALQMQESASQKVFISGDGVAAQVVPLGDQPMLLAEALIEAGVSLDSASVDEEAAASSSTISNDQLVRLKRGSKEYRFPVRALYEDPGQYYARPGDRLVVEDLRYRSEKVIIAGEVPSQTVFPISAEERQTLTDALFETSALSLDDGDTSQIYLIRRTDQIYAYHLDASNPARLVLAADLELRPDDVIFVSEQPISRFNRVLQDIVTSLGLVRAGSGS